MLRRSHVALLVLLTTASAAMVWGGCGTDAVGIEACKQIETARCEAAPTCAGKNGNPKIKTEEQVENCTTFYRDHCLLGLESGVEPKEGQAEKCVAAIQAVAKCEKDGAETIGECTSIDLVRSSSSILAPCEVFAEPELLTDCAFISKDDDTKPSLTVATTNSTTGTSSTGGDGGMGGTSGTTVSTGGSGGTGGTTVSTGGSGGSGGAGGAGGSGGAGGN